MKFTRNWSPFTMPTGEMIYRPTIRVFVKEVTDFYLYRFLVDSGADLSMAPYIVEGRVHDVDILIGEASVQINIPICFVKENVPFILGREGFFRLLYHHLRQTGQKDYLLS